MVTPRFYYVLRKDGSLLPYPPEEIDFSSEILLAANVKDYWMINPEDRETCWTMILEALAAGAERERIKELARKWQMTGLDLCEFLVRHTNPTKLEREGMEMFVEHILRVEYGEFMWMFSKFREGNHD